MARLLGKRAVFLIGLLLAPAAGGAAEKKLGFADFWTVAGATHDDTPQSLIAKWGKPAEERRGDDGVTLQWADGPSVAFSATGIMAGGLMIDLHAGAWASAHPGPATSLFGLTCAAAAARLKFTKTVGGYTTCKHYDQSGWLLDVTLMCTLGKVSSVVVNFVPIPKGGQLPADHCN
jgi:hypothetical protein